jgi:hypothetical protein
VAETGQPYAFTGDDPLNATDPLGLIKYKIQQYAEGYTSIINITRGRLNQHVNNESDHLAQAKISKKEFLNAIRETVRTPSNIKIQKNGTLLYSGPIRSVEQVPDGQIVSEGKKQVFFVSINAQNGNLVTAFVRSAPKDVNAAWSQGPWIDRNPSAPPPP